MRAATYIKRLGKYLIKGIPEKKVFVNVHAIEYGGILKGKNVVVTGGGSGIGFAIAQKCAMEGANVMITGRNAEKLKLACEKMRAHTVQYLAFDATDFECLKANVNAVFSQSGNRVDVLVNCAGVYIQKKIEQVNEQEWDSLFDTNLKAVFFMTKYFLPKLKEGSNILMVGSDNAFINSSNPYHLTKTGIDGLTRALAKEYLEKGLRVNAIAPGPTLSEINKTNPANGLQRTDKFRVLLAEEVAEIALFLISSASASINGQTICCDEGDSIR